MEVIKRLSLSKICLIFILGTSLVILLNQHRFIQNDRNRGVIKSDVVSYYAYLPATFIHKDIGLSFLNNPDSLKWYQGNWRFWPQETGTDRKAIKTAMGNAILYCPFFSAAHVLAPVFDQKQDGFSNIYHLSICLSSIFYTFLGLIILRRLLSRFFNEYLVSLGLLITFYGTNLMYYTVEEFGMSHPSSFFLISLFIYLCFKFLDRANWKNALGIGITSGLIMLVRPSNILITLILPILILGKGGIKELLKNSKYILLISIILLATISPQLFYWKYVSGKWLFFSYTGERFYFQDPKIFEGLFAYRNGWFTYTPVMILALIGIPFIQKKALKWSILTFSIVIIYFTYSWWCWWYGGSFGSRPMIDFYALFIIPILALFKKIWDSKARGKYIVITTALFFCFQSSFFTVKRHYQSIHYDRMNSEVYWEYLFKIHADPAYWYKLTKADYEKAKNRE